tara:strand:- start:422 stop:1216 length:795 start_codon:yes stop_codon:yes gene_type:complete
MKEEDVELTSVYDKVVLIQDIIIASVTGGYRDDLTYKEIRKELLNIPSISQLLPQFIKDKRSLDFIWPFMQDKHETYKERRVYISEAFTPLLNKIETTGSTINIDISTTGSSQEYIKSEWEKATQRINSDPDGAITSARSLLETVFKYILDDLKINYKEDEKLPLLYKMVSKELNLSPDQHNEQIFKQILSGSVSVVNGIGSLRNKLGDAHGKSKQQYKPEPRHAKLAVNLSSGIASFLMETYSKKKNKKDITSDLHTLCVTYD